MPGADYPRQTGAAGRRRSALHHPGRRTGLNTGVQDAVNLGWKLAQMASGTSPESLLDTYHAERHPVVGLRRKANTSWLPNSRLTVVPSHTRIAQGIVSNSPLTTNTVENGHTTPCDLTDGRYDHTTRLGS
jgi:FAD binding domain